MHCEHSLCEVELEGDNNVGVGSVGGFIVALGLDVQILGLVPDYLEVVLVKDVDLPFGSLCQRRK